MKKRMLLSGLTAPLSGLTAPIFHVIRVSLRDMLLLITAGILCVSAVSARKDNLPVRLLRGHFPGAEISRQSVYVAGRTKKELVKYLGTSPSSRLYSFYVARRKGRLVGIGVFDTHRVRTKNETLFIVVDARGTLVAVEQIAFFEPPEYRAPKRWLKLLTGKTLFAPIRPGRDLPAITGATLTVHAVARSARTILFLYKSKFQDKSK